MTLFPRILPNFQLTSTHPMSGSVSTLSPPHVLVNIFSQKALTSAEDLKQEGNNHFRTKRWDEAIALYRSALGHLPRRPQSPNSTPEAEFNDDDNDTSRLENESNSKAPAQEAAQSQPQLPSDLEIDCAKARAVLNANISACYAKLVSFWSNLLSMYFLIAFVPQGDHKEVVSACTEGKSTTTLTSVNRRLIDFILPSAER